MIMSKNAMSDSFIFLACTERIGKTVGIECVFCIVNSVVLVMCHLSQEKHKDKKRRKAKDRGKGETKEKGRNHSVDAFSERQTLNKNRGGALCTRADSPRAGPDGPRPGARRGGALWSSADGPRHRAGRFATWCRSSGSLPDDRTVRALGSDGPRVRRGGGRSPAAPGSRSREGPRRGGEILGCV
jgi:hypothetical protein